MSADSEIIGQDGLLFYIAPFTIDTLPHSIILTSPKGGGKHLISKYIAEKFQLKYIELDNKISEEDIENISFNPLPTLYVINLDNAIPKIQNNLLKIIEEPPSNIFFIGLSSCRNTILPTLLNRCTIWSLNTYSESELTKVISPDHMDIKDDLLDIFNTPGQIIKAQQYPIKKIKMFANDILDRISTSAVPNIFTIVDKIAFKNEKDKYDLDIFVKVLNNSILNKIKNDRDEKWIKMFNIISQLESKLSLCISKQRVMEEALIELKMIS